MLPADVAAAGIEGARLRCGNYLGEPRFRTCGIVLGTAERREFGLRIAPGYLNPAPDKGTGGTRRPYLTGRHDPPAGFVDWWEPKGGYIVDRWVTRCSCGKDQVLRPDLIVPEFVAAVRAGATPRSVRVNTTGAGRRNGQRLMLIDLYVGKGAQ